MTYVAIEQYWQDITLYRGERAELRSHILLNGVGGQIRDVDQLRLIGLPLDLLSHLACDEIATHVLHSSQRSPLVSWTTSREKASWYALAGGHRSHGILLETTLRLRRRSYWQNSDGTYSVAYEDARRRQLIPTATFGALTARAVASPEEIAQIRALGAGDAEYLVMGRINGYEMTIGDVRARPTHAAMYW